MQVKAVSILQTTLNIDAECCELAWLCQLCAEREGGGIVPLFLLIAMQLFVSEGSLVCCISISNFKVLGVEINLHLLLLDCFLFTLVFV